MKVFVRGVRNSRFCSSSKTGIHCSMHMRWIKCEKEVRQWTRGSILRIDHGQSVPWQNTETCRDRKDDWKIGRSNWTKRERKVNHRLIGFVLSSEWGYPGRSFSFQVFINRVLEIILPRSLPFCENWYGRQTSNNEEETALTKVLFWFWRVIKDSSRASLRIRLYLATSNLWLASRLVVALYLLAFSNMLKHVY